jgi:DMSO/TMAO reductase YedYZ molybdopterin-dependent catalytic subunit
VLHLEAEVPRVGGLVVDGLVAEAADLSLSDLRCLDVERRRIPVHCVWGWSRPDAVWDGVSVARILDLCRPTGTYVVVRSSSGAYSSCMPLEDAGRGMLAWARDGEPLPPNAGGPLRFVVPADHWGYKGVKWSTRITVVDRFEAGFWESKVADPIGRIAGELEIG